MWLFGQALCFVCFILHYRSMLHTSVFFQTATIILIMPLRSRMHFCEHTHAGAHVHCATVQELAYICILFSPFFLFLSTFAKVACRSASGRLILRWNKQRLDIQIKGAAFPSDLFLEQLTCKTRHLRHQTGSRLALWGKHSGNITPRGRFNCSIRVTS